MAFTRTGFILYTRKYRECRLFYQDILQLPMLFQTDEVSCFEFGDSYLMVEPEEAGADAQTTPAQRTCLRMNVPNIRQRADDLIARGIAIDFQEHPWGRVAKFTDPDGNLCAFKDDETFEQQVLKGKK